MANKKKKFLPDNIIELMFGLGASIVIIGALLKITHADLILAMLQEIQCLQLVLLLRL